MTTHNFLNAPWHFEEYGTICAVTRIDIEHTLRDGFVIRRTFILLFQVNPTAKGIDNEGNRGCGFATPTIIDGTRKPDYPLIQIGDDVHTPFGDYRVAYASKTDHDNLKLSAL